MIRKPLSAAAAAMAMLTSIGAHAAEIKILSTHAVLEVLSEISPQFERASGHRLSFSYDPANVIKRRIESGETFDVAIVSRSVLDALAKEGKIASDARASIGRSGLGLSVRQGAPKPDISTIEAFKRTLLSAKSLVRSTEGTSGLYFESLLKRLGIADEMKDKTRLGPSGRVAEMVARGEVEMAVQQISELLPVSGAQFVGPFPPDLQLYTMFAAGINSATLEPQVARAFVNFLTAPAAAPIIRAKGLEPIN